MWILPIFLLVAATGVMADLAEEIEECTKIVDVDDIESLIESTEANELDALCPAFLNLFECLEEALHNEIGLTLEQLLEIMEGTEPARFLKVAINTRNVLKDLCDEDSQIHKDYLANAECLKSIDKTELCEREAQAAYDTFKEFEDSVQEGAGEDEDEDDQACMKTAFNAACVGVEIKETCGDHAFDTYQQLIRRTTIFRYGLCSEKQMETVKTNFLDSLEMDSAQRELYALALDLKKKRK